MAQPGIHSFQRRVTFVIPNVNGNYAPEVLYLRDTNASGPFHFVFDLGVVIEDALPSGAAIEVDVLKPGGNPATAGDWIVAEESFTAKSSEYLSYPGWYGVRIRAKSGGTGGNVGVSANWTT